MQRGGRMPHALLVEGPSGCGKKLFARFAAQLSLCATDEKPCGECPPCVKVEKQVHPDVCFYMVPEGKREFPVELVRQLRQDAYMLPNEGAYKIYIIDQAHMMNTAAQNALLKVIEEPPAHVRFILLCENRNRMLETILSRVVSIAMEVTDVAQCERALAQLAPESSEQMRGSAAAGASGNIGLALSLLGEAKPSKAAADAKKLCQVLVFGSRYEALCILAGYDKNREELIRMLEQLRDLFSQVVVGRYRPMGSGLDERFENRVSVQAALQAAQAVESAAEFARRNVGISLVCAQLVEQVKRCL